MAHIHIVPEIPAWLLDDTKESVLGTEWHQEAYGAMAAMLREEADRRGATWGVCEQIELSGLPRPGGKTYNPRPDVMVLKQPIAGNLAAVSLSAVGAPLLVVEIVSSSTLRTDLEGKRIAYALAGVPEYLLFDPAGTVLATPIVARHLPDPTARVYQSWPPEADGTWRSRMLDVWFVPHPPFLRVRGNDGRLLDHPLGTARRARHMEERALALERQVVDLQGRNRQLEAALQQLRQERDRRGSNASDG